MAGTDRTAADASGRGALAHPPAAVRASCSDGRMPDGPLVQAGGALRRLLVGVLQFLACKRARSHQKLVRND